MAAGLALRHHCRHIREMRPLKKKATAAKLRSWRVSFLRQRAEPQHLGVVEAPDEKAAEAEAVAEFKLNDEQRKRLVVQKRD